MSFETRRLAAGPLAALLVLPLALGVFTLVRGRILASPPERARNAKSRAGQGDIAAGRRLFGSHAGGQIAITVTRGLEDFERTPKRKENIP